MPFVDVARERAKKLDTDKKCRWPNGIGTHVYKIIESIKNNNRL